MKENGFLREIDKNVRRVSYEAATAAAYASFLTKTFNEVEHPTEEQQLMNDGILGLLTDFRGRFEAICGELDELSIYVQRGKGADNGQDR